MKMYFELLKIILDYDLSSINKLKNFLCVRIVEIIIMITTVMKKQLLSLLLQYSYNVKQYVIIIMLRFKYFKCYLLIKHKKMKNAVEKHRK